MSGLTTVERLVLESIGQCPKEIHALMNDTKLELRFLANIVHALTLRSFIVRTNEGYTLNRHLPDQEKSAINEFSAKKYEALELVGGLLTHENSPLKVRKVSMTDKDRTMLRGMLNNIEEFVKGLPAPAKDSPTHNWSVVVWGEDRYGSVINRLIGEV
jgi:hypothetical protein